jgi:putative component of membrane protein insertase Oxa1/YidC/SpoIIIJ protein YidD
MKPIKPIWSVGIIFLILFFSLATAVHASDFKGPWDQDSSQKASQKQIEKKVNPLRLLVEVYRSYISPIDGKDCPMYPSCSEYSLQCFKKYGLFIGWMMTCDRLFRCGRDELRLSPQIIVNGKFKCYDPLEKNDFWWYHEH